MAATDAVRDGKLFVLDTNVLLHDSGSLWNFAEHDVVLPITVLEELDQFKKGNAELNFHAREVLRRLDELTGDVMSPNGASLGDDRGHVRVMLSGGLDERLRATLLHDSPDHRILSCALFLQTAEPGREVVLVTKDSNLRMKAKAYGLTAQDYFSDRTEDIDRLYTGKRTVLNLPSEVIDLFYADTGDVDAQLIPGLDSPRPNENFVLKNGSKSALATFRSAENRLHRVSKPTAFGITARNAEQSFALTALLNDDIKLVTLTGKAGSGKTLLALAAGLEARS
ncbi:MAG: PhoH family protein, partial [Planctomycetaceae bacterium]|nr:PhoH family protein [Planctomycetaceae bacterium]